MTGHTITRTKGHILISEEVYLWNEMLKTNRTQIDDELNKLMDCFVHLHKHEHLSNMEIKGKDTVLMSHSGSVDVTRVGLTQRKDRDKTHNIL